MKSKLTIFKNEKVGQPKKRNDGTIVEYNGEPMLHSALNAKINLPEGLTAGDYEVAVYQYVSKAGLKYYSGTIKPAFKPAKKGDAPKEKAKSIDNVADTYFPDDDLNDVGF